MSGRHATLEYNLALLQDCIRRDPGSYKEEFLEQYRHFEHTLKLFRLQPSLDPTRLLELINFHSHVAQCYRKETSKLADDLMELLKTNADNLHPHLRLGTVKALALLRNKNLASPFACLRLFFDLSKCRDKELRKFLFTSTIQFIKLLNTKRKDAKMNSQLQNFMLAQLQTVNTSKVVARMALLLLIDLYRRRIWMNAKTVNAIAMGGCLSPVTKLSATACKFFLGKELEEEGDDKASSDEEDNNNNNNKRTLKEVMVGYKAGKKTKNRKKTMDREKQAIEKRDKDKRNKKGSARDAGVGALRLLYDPQEFAERLFRKVEQKGKSERFEFRILVMALLARVIGLHKLQVLNFYTFLLRYLQPRQQDVTKILLFAAQASHEMVPSDSVEILLKTIVDNFVSDRNSPEAMTVGLNACREILTNCPTAIDEDLLRDLVEYKKYRNKNVSMAARSLIQLFRRINPKLLHKRDRGRPEKKEEEDDEEEENESGDEDEVDKGEEIGEDEEQEEEKVDEKGNRKRKRKGEDEEEEEDDEEERVDDLPRLKDIEHLHKRAKMDREARMETVRAGREGREKFGRPKAKGSHVGRTNKNLAKNKVFGMARRKDAKKMKRRSFREKQQALRKYLVNQKKMK